MLFPVEGVHFKVQLIRYIYTYTYVCVYTHKICTGILLLFKKYFYFQSCYIIMPKVCLVGQHNSGFFPPSVNICLSVFIIIIDFKNIFST